VVRSAIGLEAVDANFVRSVQIPARVAPERLHMAVVALRLPAEELVATSGSRRIETARGRLRGRKRELIELQSLKLRSNQVVIGADMLPVRKPQISEAVGCRDWELPGSFSRGSQKRPFPCISRVATNAFQ